MDKSSIMSRVALGNVASLGELYDARTDRFCSINILKKTIPEEALTHTDNHFSDIQLVHSDTIGEKFLKLDVSAELQVSVLAGFFTLQGSGRYLKDQKNSSRSVKSSLIYNIRTKEDNVNIYSEELKDAFALDAVQSGVATHVVVGITWGANSVLSCEYLNTENRDVTEIEGNLSAQLHKLGVSISGKASVDFKEGENDKGINFSIRIYGDVLPRDQELPTTFEAALELMKKMPSLVATCNDGRGMPLNYKLIPLTLLKAYLKFEMQLDLIIRSLQEYSLVRIVQLYEKLNQAQQQLNDLKKDATQNKFAIGSTDMRKVNSLAEDFSVNEAKFRAELGKMLYSVRSGKADGSELDSLLSRFESSPCSSTAIESALNQMSYIHGKIAFAKTLAASGIQYIGYGASFDDEIVKNFDTKTYVFFFNEECKTSKDDQSLWLKNRQIFLQEANSKSKEFKFMAVDCTIHESLWPGKVTIHVIQSGKVITPNLVQEQDQSSSIYHIRELVVQLTRLLGEIWNKIQISKEVILDHIAEINRTKTSIAELEAKQFQADCDSKAMILKQVESETAKQLINGKMLATKLKQDMISEQEKRILEPELKPTSGKCVCLLKPNAITPYNYAMFEYMDHLIAEEKIESIVCRCV